MKELKALEILKRSVDKLNEEYRTTPLGSYKINNIVLERGYINIAIKELEEINNRSCRNCKYCSDDCDEDGE